MEHRFFLGEMDESLERWLGDVFISWVPSGRQLLIQAGDIEVLVPPGTVFTRREDVTDES